MQAYFDYIRKPSVFGGVVATVVRVVREVGASVGMVIGLDGIPGVGSFDGSTKSKQFICGLSFRAKGLK